MRCASAQIRIIKVHEVLAQITRDNFFLWKDKEKNLAWLSINLNKQRKSCVSTNHKKQFFFLWKDKNKNLVWACTYHNEQTTTFSIETQRQIYRHKSQKIIFFYERTRIKTWCMLAQIIKNRFQYVLAQITRDNFFLWKDKDKKRGVCWHKSK